MCVSPYRDFESEEERKWAEEEALREYHAIHGGPNAIEPKGVIVAKCKIIIPHA
jgi:hypothetical protein